MAVRNVLGRHKQIIFRNPQPGFLNLRTNKFSGLIESFTRDVSRQRGTETNGTYIGIVSGDSGIGHKKTSTFPIKFLSATAELENDPDKEFIKNLETEQR